MATFPALESLWRESRGITLVLLAIWWNVAGLGAASPANQTLDLSDAIIVCAGAGTRNNNAAEFLQSEIEQRTGLQLAITNALPGASVPAILLGTMAATTFTAPQGFSVPEKPEGYSIWVDAATRSAPTVYLIGRDDRGALFAAGRLLRLLNLSRGYLTLAAETRVATAPGEAFRAQQIFSSSQSKDGYVNWRDGVQKQRYISDLILFGANTLEPRPATGAKDVDRFLDGLGLDLVLVVPCQDLIDYNNLSDDQIKSLFTDVVGVKHFTTYGGDASGAMPAPEVFPAMERVIPLVLQNRPEAKWWFSNQCLEDHAVDYDDYIFNFLKTKQPEWLYGMVYGPWTKRGIRDIRADLPAQYVIFQKPDISHVRWCQYPVPQWDQVWAQVWPRNQSIYAMPAMMAQMHQATRQNTIGFLPYSHTGVYNDLNKFVWAAKGWDPAATVGEILYDYAKAFFAYDFITAPKGEFKSNATDAKAKLIDAGARSVARGLELLEENWTGAVAQNTSCEAALKLWKDIATNMGGVGGNWRLELFLYKAFLDAQVKHKYDAEQALERQAYAALRQASKVGLAQAIRNARAALARIDSEFQSQQDFKKELRSWGLSPRFGDLDTILANIYAPLNDRRWLESQMEDVSTIADLEKILNYEDPGPGGFYDNLGVAGQQPHLVRQKTWEEDPGFVYSPIEWVDHSPGSDRRRSQMTHALARYDTPLRMRWEGLDPKAIYHIEVVYRGPFSPETICETDDGQLIHAARNNTNERPVRYLIPPSSTRDGVLGLQWKIANNVRGVSVTEIWLKKD